MPELATAIGYRLQPKVFTPIDPSSYFNKQLPIQPAIPVDKAAKAQVFGSLVKALGELPGQLTKEWEAGKKRGETSVEDDQKRATEKQVRSKFDAAMAGPVAVGSPQLSDFVVGADGSVTMKPVDAELRKAQINHLNSIGGDKPGKPTAYDKLIKSFAAPEASSEPPLPTDGTPKMVATTFGYPTDSTPDSASLGTGAYASKGPTGAFGPLRETSIGVSPDVETYLKSQGVKPRDPVVVTLADGTKVTRTWDDRAAPDAMILAGKVPGVTKPLRGRVDFYSPTGHNPYADKSVISVTPVKAAANDVADPNSPVAAVAPNETNQPDNGPALSSFLPPGAAPTPEQVQQIDAGVSNAVGQLSGLTNENLTASNAPAGQVAPIKPPGEDLSNASFDTDYLTSLNQDSGTSPTATAQAAPRPLDSLKEPEIRRAHGIEGRSVNHESGEIYLRSGDTVKTLNPITGVITLDMPDGERYEMLPGANTWRKGEKKEEDTELESIADAIISGEQPPELKGFYKKAVPLRAILAKRGYDLSTATKDWQATQRNIATMNGPQQLRTRQSVDNAYHQLEVIEELGRKWAGGKYPLLNRGQLTLAKHGVLGEDAQSLAQRFEGQINDLVSELGNVYQGGTSPTNHALQLAAQNLKADFSEKTLMDSINVIRQNLKIRQNSLNNIEIGGASSGNVYDKSSKGDSAPSAPAAASPTSSKVKMAKPDGTVISVPADKVEQAKALGATLVK